MRAVPTELIRRLAAMLAVLIMALAPASGWSGEAVPTEQDPMLAKREVQLAEQLRCLVCQNQSIAESSAELAIDLRRQIRDQIKEGRSDGEIVDFMVQRYGDFVLYRPPFKATTLLLWLGPLLLLVTGVVVLVRNVRGRRTRGVARGLTEEERRQAALLLAEGGKDSP